MIEEAFSKHKMPFARLLASSKLTYQKNNPDHLVIYNARIYEKEYYEKQKYEDIKDWFKGQEQEIWYGDIDFNIDIKHLANVVKETRKSIVITKEDGTKVMELSY